MLELLNIFADNIAPILLIALVGFIVGRRLRIDPTPLGRVIFNVFSPALVFNALATNTIPLGELGLLALTMTLFVVTMTLVAYVAYNVTRGQAGDRLGRAGVILSSVCPNNGNLGLSLIGFAFSDDVFARAAIIYIVVTFLNYTGGIFIASSGRLTPKEAVWNITRTPAIYAALVGLIVNASGIMLPLMVQRSVGLLSQAAIPAMLILLGLQLARVTRIERPQLVSLAAGLRLLVSPLLATALVLLLGVHGPASIAVIMQASMPVAVVTVIFAAEFGLDDRLASSTVLASTLLSPVTLSVLILLLRQSTGA